MQNINLSKIGSKTEKLQAKSDARQAEYLQFKKQWQATHSMSPAPSFTSWMKNYRNK